MRGTPVRGTPVGEGPVRGVSGRKADSASDPDRQDRVGGTQRALWSGSLRVVGNDVSEVIQGIFDGLWSSRRSHPK